MNKTNTPDILIILSDQHRWDCLGAYGNTRISTPNLDGLANDGITFDSAFCPFPVCAPSRASLLTSLYPFQHGASKNGATMPEGYPTFPQAFRNAGYRTTAIGKMHLTPTYADVGFESMNLAEQDGPGRHDDDYHRYLREHDLCDENDLEDQVMEFRKEAPQEYYDTFGAKVSNLPEEHHSTTWIADRTVENIAAWDDHPHLLVSSFIKPHHPFDPPARWVEMYDPDSVETLPGWTDAVPSLDARRGPGYFPNEKLTDSAIRRATAYYYAAITHMDHHIGRILEQLKRSGRYENTIVVYASDHGELMGFHHLLLKHNYMYEPLIRVPHIWKLAGGYAAGTRRDDFVSLLDIGPTLGSLAGVSLDGQPMGHDIFSDSSRDYIYVESDDEYMVRTRHHKLLYMDNVEQRQLIDLDHDPLELENRYQDPDYAPVREDLENKLFRTALFETRPPVHLDPQAPCIDAPNAVSPEGEHRNESIEYFRRKMRTRRS